MTLVFPPFHAQHPIPSWNRRSSFSKAYAGIHIRTSNGSAVIQLHISIHGTKKQLQAVVPITLRDSILVFSWAQTHRWHPDFSTQPKEAVGTNEIRAKGSGISSFRMSKDGMNPTSKEYRCSSQDTRYPTHAKGKLHSSTSKTEPWKPIIQGLLTRHKLRYVATLPEKKCYADAPRRSLLLARLYHKSLCSKVGDFDTSLWAVHCMSQSCWQK